MAYLTFRPASARRLNRDKTFLINTPIMPPFPAHLALLIDSTGLSGVNSPRRRSSTRSVASAETRIAGGKFGPEIESESSPRSTCSSLLHLKRGWPGSQVYDLGTGRHPCF